MSSYEDTWGAESRHYSSLPEKTVPEKTALLETVKAKCCQPSDWLETLARTYNDTAYSAARDYQHSSQAKCNMTFWMNKLFAKLETYATQFNFNVACPCIQLAVFMPEFHKIALSEGESNYSTSSKKAVFDGHLSTANATLLVRGSDDTIVAYLVPAQQWLALSCKEVDPRDFPPMAEMQASKSGLNTCIYAHNEVRELFVDQETLPLLARFLFSELIEFQPRS